jgi:RHS repeat-associated protein
LPGQVGMKVADVRSANDYYPFGFLMPGRSYNSDSYRYGFNGKEKDDEINGEVGSSYDFGARIYDPRTGRFLSTDPKMKDFPSQTPYAFAGNSPISNITCLMKMLVHWMMPGAK